MPKILISTQPIAIAETNEKWLFPSGAGMVLPLYNVFPVVFFYGLCDQECSYDNYLTHVANKFDEEWLRNKNIQYLFVPACGGGRIAGLNRLLVRKKVVAKSGNAMLIKLF